MRKARKDSKLHGLAREQRAMVDKWLFDKGLTYQAVSEACLQMFGLKVSKSSVGRYHERELRGKVRKKREECRKGAGSGVSVMADEEVGGWAREMCIGMLAGRGTSGTEEAYQKTLVHMTKWALEEMRWPVEDERDLKGVLRVMRILISARREKNEADMMKLAWRKFETKSARQCLHAMAERKGVRRELHKLSRSREEVSRALTSAATEADGSGGSCVSRGNRQSSRGDKS
jgi:hypothetical protein